LEDDLYRPDRITPNFFNFLNFLGQIGDIVGRYDAASEHVAIRLHVAPLISFGARAAISSCPVVIVFKEGDIFAPSIKVDSTAAVYIVVEELTDHDDVVHYQIQVAARINVQPFPPFLRDPPIYPRNEETRQFLLKKISYACRAASIASRETIRGLEVRLQAAVEPFTAAFI